MKRLIGVLVTVSFLAGGCVSKPIQARPEQRFVDTAIAMWRFKLDGVPHVFVGGIAKDFTDVKKTTAFFLVPASEWDAKTFVTSLEEDGHTISVGGVRLEVREFTISEPRIFRFQKGTDSRWSLTAISGLLPPNPTRPELLSILGACLNREVGEMPLPRQTEPTRRDAIRL